MMKVCLHCCCTFIMGTYLHSFYLIQFYKIRLEGRLPECPRIQYIIRNRKHLWFNIVVNNPILQKKERQTGKLYIYIRQCFFFLTLEKYHALEKPNSNIWILTVFSISPWTFLKNVDKYCQILHIIYSDFMNIALNFELNLTSKKKAISL